MKKLFLIGAFLILILFGAAAQVSDNLQVSGSVPQVLNITMGADVVFVLDVAGGTISLGDVVVRSNLKSWILRIWSVNGSKLKNSDSEEISYSVSLTGVSPITGFSGGTLQSSSPSSGTGYIAIVDKTAKAGVTLPLSITYSGEGVGTFWSYDKDNFIDTVHVAVSVN